MSSNVDELHFIKRHKRAKYSTHSDGIQVLEGYAPVMSSISPDELQILENGSHFVPRATRIQSQRLNNFKRTLVNDRLIKIYAGDQPEPYVVQEVILESISTKFSDRLREQETQSGEDGILRFPADDRGAWDVLLYWKYNEKLEHTHAAHPDAKMKVLIQCWVLADKYNIKQFQDEAMWELIKMVEHRGPAMDTIKLAFDTTAPGSKLRNLMAEELLYYMETEGKFDHIELDLFDGVQGFAAELMRATDRKARESSIDVLRTRTAEPRRRAVFMVGPGPKNYRIHSG